MDLSKEKIDIIVEFMEILAPQISEDAINQIIRSQRDIKEIVSVLIFEKQRRWKEILDYRKRDRYLRIEGMLPPIEYQKIKFDDVLPIEVISEVQKNEIEKIKNSFGFTDITCKDFHQLILSSLGVPNDVLMKEYQEAVGFAAQELSIFGKSINEVIEMKKKKKNSVNPNDRNYQNRKKW